MINELYALSQTLSNIGIKSETWHREYKELPNASTRAPCLRIWVSEKGVIGGLDELKVETVQKLRKFGNNQASFPAFNIKPLYRIFDEQQKKMLEEMTKDPSLLRVEIVKGLLINDNWHKSLKNIDNALVNISSRLQEAIDQCNDDYGQVVTSLIQSVGSLKGGLRAALKSYILSALEDGLNTSTLLRVLLHSGNENKAAIYDTGSNISVILDLVEWESYGYPVASERITAWINSALLCADEAKTLSVDGINEHEVDAFGSPYSCHMSEPMPNVKIPGFSVTLRSMFHEQRCQQRYGEFDDGSYYIAKANRTAVKQALEWIASQDYEGVTWKRADKDEIVFVYPSMLTEIPLRYASLLGSAANKDAKSNKARARFEECAENFISAFKGLPPKNLPKHIRVFSIRKMDKARSKVVFTRNLSSEWLVKMAEDWQLGSLNIPIINGIVPNVPFPLEVARILNTAWKRDGKQLASGKKLVNRVQYYQGIELLLYSPTEQNHQCAKMVKCFLNLILYNTEGLIYYFGNRCHNGTDASTYYKEQIADIAAMFGLLLHKNGFIKEVYMQDTAFIVGQILKISDELHTLYCKVVRNGDVPPQLAGNAVFFTASETPHKALAHLSQRMSPYLSWAKQYSRGKKSWKSGSVKPDDAGWYLNLFEDLSTKLTKTLTEPVRFNDFDKAQLFLGYLAAFPKREKLENESETYNDND